MREVIRVKTAALDHVHSVIQVESSPSDQLKESGSETGRRSQPSEVTLSFVFLARKHSRIYYGQTLSKYHPGDRERIHKRRAVTDGIYLRVKFEWLGFIAMKDQFRCSI